MTSPVDVKGIANLPPETALWVVIRPPSKDFYLTTPAPVIVDPNGEWTTKAGVGRAGGIDAGKSYDIYPVLAPQSGSQFAQWVPSNPGRYGPFHALPADTTRLEGIRVTLAG